MLENESFSLAKKALFWSFHFFFSNIYIYNIIALLQIITKAYEF